MDFWMLYDRLNFPIMLLIGEILICHRFGKKDHHILKLLLGIVPALVVSYFWEDLFAWDEQWGIFIQASKFLVVFLCSFPAMFMAFKGDFWSYLFTGIMAYCAQHIAYQSHTIVHVLTGRILDRWGQMIILIMTTAFVYTLLYYVFVRKLKKNEIVKVNNHAQVVVSGVVLLITAYISFFGVIFSEWNKTPRVLLIIMVFSILSCFMAIMQELSLVHLKQNETELAILKHMLHQAKYQYRETKENIDLINIKCHDLRHQISHLRGQVNEEELARITEAVDIYDASFKTGNDALDIVLMEKGLHCMQKGIRLTCMMDGSLVERMRDSDIYSLFGNALENAMQSAEGLDEERRSISISGYEYNGFAVIRIENYYDGELSFVDGLPMTKKSTKYHGFGVKSMKIIVENYGGDIEFSLHGDIFRLDIFFPMSAEKEQA